MHHGITLLVRFKAPNRTYRLNKGSREAGMVGQLDGLKDTNDVGVQYIRKSMQYSGSY